MFFGLLYGDQNFKWLFGLSRGSEFLNFFRSSLWGSEFLNVSWSFFLWGSNFFIPAWVFLGGIRNYESYNKKVPKELCTKSSLFDGIRKKS